MLTSQSAFAKGVFGSRTILLVFITLSSLGISLTVSSRVTSRKSTRGEDRPSVASALSAPRSRGIRKPVPDSSSTVVEKRALGDSLLVPQTPSGNERSVSLNFDNLSSGQPPFFIGRTTINDLFPDIKFSSPAGNVFVYPGSFFENAPSSKPNVISPAVPSAPLIMSFPQPVNNFVFSIVAEDDYGTIGGLNWCQRINGATTCSQPQPVSGIGAMGNYYPMVFDFGRAGINNLTQVSFVPVSNDADGLAYDDISFTVPVTAPTPAPTPTPSPGPPAPRLLAATAGDEEVSLQWTDSLAAECQLSQDPNHHCAYKVKQVTQAGFPISGGTAIVSASETNYTYRNLAPGVKAYFAGAISCVSRMT
jgi:hypothetical protein